MSDTVLQFDRVTRSYPLGETVVYGVRDLSVSFKRGEFAALVGPSGSGKSTLQHLGAGYDSPNSGRVLLMGRSISECTGRELAQIRNRMIGFVFQTFNLLPVLNVIENVAYPALLYPRPGETRSTIESRALALIERVGLSSKIKKRPHQLSGGERQRVAIARALINNPVLVFADEPTANLDHETGSTVLDMLESLNAERGATLILATHDPEVMKRARRVLRMKDGRLVEDSTCSAS